ncbi:HAD family hydrolase [Thioclava sp. SK-1]|uniref:HAD family hydrolase n=1 Tax=Thioclava sp. SK-1 TaxID=1889770 RepID=UPI000A8EF65F
MAPHADPEHLSSRLLAAERRNIAHYGFGVKGFTLSLIETALEVSNNTVPGSVIRDIIAAGREMLAHPVDLLPHARSVIETLSRDFHIILVTKGDLLDQERKLAQSGLGDLFDAVEIVSDKTEATYRSVFNRHADGATMGAMIGNSMRSDVLPMIAAGGWGIYVPHELTWGYELAEHPENHTRFAEIDSLADLPDLVAKISEPIT